MRLRIEPLNEGHDRASFSCGNLDIDDFLRKYARQRQERKLGTTMVAVDADGECERIVGFYTLLPHEFRGNELPDPYRRAGRAGKVHAVPGALLAQMGVDLRFQGMGVGSRLIRHALERTAYLAQEFGCVAIVTDPIDDRARILYARFDFKPIADGPRMILSVRTILEAIGLTGRRDVR